MSLDSNQTQAVALSECRVGARAGSLGKRLLGGAGVLTLFAYRAQPRLSIETTGHWRFEQDSILVVLPPAERAVWNRLVLGERLGVRMDITMQATTAELKVTTAAIHALGTLECPSVPDLDAALTSEGVPTGFMMAAAVEGARVARVRFGRVILHDSAGITALDIDRLPVTEPYPQASEALHAAEAVYALGEDWRERIFEQVLTGVIPGTISAPDVLPQLRRRCAPDLIDVDANGLTMMLIDAENTRTVFVPFERPVCDARQLDDALGALSACPGYAQRI